VPSWPQDCLPQDGRGLSKHEVGVRRRASRNTPYPRHCSPWMGSVKLGWRLATLGGGKFSGPHFSRLRQHSQVF
jgi:hypothetical protein